MLVAENRGQPLGDRAILGQPTDQRRRHSERLKLLVEPVGDRLVLVAVAEEGMIFELAAARAAQRRAIASGRTIICRQLRNSSHRRPLHVAGRC